MRPDLIAYRTPKYRLLARNLAARIRSGQLASGTVLPSESQLIRDTGASRITVRAAIAELAKQGLVACQQGRRTRIVYHPPAASNTVVLTLTYRTRIGLAHPYTGSVVRGINFALGDANIDHAKIDIEMTNVAPPVIDRIGGEVLQVLAVYDGVFLLFPCLEAHEIDCLVDQGKPVVSIGVHLDTVDIPRVHMDEVSGYRTVIEHLLELGHRRIGAVATSLSAYPIEQGCNRTRVLLELFNEYADEGRLVTHPEWFRQIGEFQHEEGLAAGRELLAQPTDRPTAIIATEDSVAFGVIQAAAELGLRTPDDISVTGMGNYHTDQSPTLTTLVVPSFEMGIHAGQAMLAELNHRGPRNLPPFPLELVIGQTTGPPPRTPGPTKAFQQKAIQAKAIQATVR